jgi:hypothetical protein
MPILGASPLGISFFSQRKGGFNFVQPHVPFTKEKAKELGENLKKVEKDIESRTKVSVIGGSVSNFKVDAGLNFLTFGDKQTIFTHNPKNPNTFYVYYNRNNDSRKADDTKGSLVDYLESAEFKYYNSNYIDQNSSISKIIDKLKSEESGEDAPRRNNRAVSLKHSDFAYLKKLGVYPSNRLIVARRFGLGVGDDLVRYQNEPTAVVASYIEDAKEFISISFGEAWEQVTNANFGTEANQIAKEYRFGAVGDFINAGGNLFAAPGFTEYLQYYLFNQAELTSEENLLLLPAGNPNIIRKAQKRQTYGGNSKSGGGEDQAFSGLKYTFSISIKTEYEIKYIDGIDPTLVYFDIISNLLRFGTSEAQFQFDERFNDKARQAIEKFSSGDFTEVMLQVASMLKGMLSAAKDTTNSLLASLFGMEDASKNQNGKAGDFNYTEAILSSQIKKYRLAFIGLVQALSGSPSGIYHVTVGNPLRPLFASGDLVPSDTGAKISLGTELGYNNLPTSITFDMTLANARPCGLQEIYRKFSPYPIRETTAIDFGKVEKGDKRTIDSELITRPRTTVKRTIFNRNSGGLASRIFGR